jgi:DNA-directed RNA polymerase specialized sigma24 family protein
MRNVEGLTFEEIALVLDLQSAAVRQRYGRALIKLRAKLKDS